MLKQEENATSGAPMQADKLDILRATPIIVGSNKETTIIGVTPGSIEIIKSEQ